MTLHIPLFIRMYFIAYNNIIANDTLPERVQMWVLEATQLVQTAFNLVNEL